MVTPNKKLNSGPLAEYLAVKQLQRQGKAHYMYEVRSPFVSVGSCTGRASCVEGGQQRQGKAHCMCEASSSRSIPLGDGC